MHDFEQLDVWSLSHQLAIEIYRLTEHLPASERFGLTDQVRRSAVSVPANLAEGCGRHSAADFARFVDISAGSAFELDYLIRLCGDLGYTSAEQTTELRSRIGQVKRMLYGLRAALAKPRPS